ncbi:putative P-loop containing nucleoside triphosphate hydrolase [Medicago truncatula]|uniref:Sulfotransferase n=1 Tax=Medicago truncatula TaxID=3880 RepID=A0A072UW61_MEDTR|nr:cytosolic sulfotransferase 12 isoform X1 [Medicago truncatula]KEH33293.1 P-loop nucleoside triphosphate hydrolase superfamily protein [Medicago truncatula]RHN66511.1 putative P-loop containing nucleoside triphosphate hydrolase [Medicago truncatula]
MAKLGDENSLVPKYLQEDELGKECKELIQTLPLEKGWISTHFHQYQGFWIGTRILQGVLSCQKHFQALNTDILLVTTPKSGTTWLKALTFALINRKKYQNIHNFNHPLLTSNPHVLVPFLEVDLYYDKDYVPNLNSLSPPRLFATHIPYELLPKSVKESSCKVVYLCRDPKDTFASLWHFSNKVRSQSSGTLPLEESFHNFTRGVTLFGPFWEHVLGYWKESLERSNKVMFLRFEEMKMKPDFHLKKLAEFLECPFTKDEESKGVVDDILNLCSFEKLSNLEVNKTGKVSFGVENKAFFRRGQVGDGEKLLTTEMIEQLNTVIEEKLVKHGFNF